jgi:hypothetical protein
VAEYDRAGTLRVVDASLASQAWMGPVDAAAEAHEAQRAGGLERVLSGSFQVEMQDGGSKEVC